LEGGSDWKNSKSTEKKKERKDISGRGKRIKQQWVRTIWGKRIGVWAPNGVNP